MLSAFLTIWPIAYIDVGTLGAILQMLIAGLVGAALIFRQTIARFLGLFSRRGKSEGKAENPATNE
jgi:hypothetical protein